MASPLPVYFKRGDLSPEAAPDGAATYTEVVARSEIKGKGAANPLIEKHQRLDRVDVLPNGHVRVFKTENDDQYVELQIETHFSVKGLVHEPPAERGPVEAHDGFPLVIFERADRFERQGGVVLVHDAVLSHDVPAQGDVGSKAPAAIPRGTVVPLVVAERRTGNYYLLPNYPASRMALLLEKSVAGKQVGGLMRARNLKPPSAKRKRSSDDESVDAKRGKPDD